MSQVPDQQLHGNGSVADLAANTLRGKPPAQPAGVDVPREVHQALLLTAVAAAHYGAVIMPWTYAAFPMSGAALVTAWSIAADRAQRERLKTAEQS